MDDKVQSYTYEQIEELATKVRDRFGIPESNFIDITELADEMGYDVYDAEFENSEILSTMSEDDEEDSGKCIYINKNLSESEKRFNIANQVAHIILNHNSRLRGNEYLVEYRSRYKGVSTSKEYGEKMQAMLLAASLLMPTDFLTSAWSKYRNTQLIADYFKVPVNAAILRLEALGLV